MTTPDDEGTSTPGGTPVPPPPQVGEPPLPPGREIMTARDAYPFVPKQIG